MRRLFALCLLFTGCLSSWGGASHASALEPHLRTKARVIRKLLDWITWPAIEPGRPLVIAVQDRAFCEGALRRELGQVKVSGRPLRLFHLQSLEDSLQIQCDLLILSPRAEENLAAVVAHLKRRPMVMIGEGKGLAAQGVTVNLVPESGERMRLQINATSLKNSGALLSPQVLRGAELFY
ncbi:MAG: YfiR family protein [Firmicutes bacterium]|nr:YfiR family protein [Bacillota bacterium]